jgi:hypothetical protein
VFRTPFSIGYVEQAYARGLLLPFAAIRNKAGNYVIPSTQTVATDAAQKPAITPANFSIVNQPGANSYPISGYSWALVYTRQHSQATGQKLVSMLDWLTHNGQSSAAANGYVPLPPRTRALARTMLQQITGPSGRLLRADGVLLRRQTLFFPTGDGNLSEGFGPWEGVRWWEARPTGAGRQHAPPAWLRPVPARSSGPGQPRQRECCRRVIHRRVNGRDQQQLLGQRSRDRPQRDTPKPRSRLDEICSGAHGLDVGQGPGNRNDCDPLALSVRGCHRYPQ